MNILIWLIAAYGMSQILVYGSIFDNTRLSIHKWGQNKLLPFNFLGKFISELISCMMCTSTWVGFFMSLVLGGLTKNYFNTSWFVSLFLDGMFTAGSVWMLNSVVEFFEENRIK